MLLYTMTHQNTVKCNDLSFPSIYAFTRKSVKINERKIQSYKACTLLKLKIVSMYASLMIWHNKIPKDLSIHNYKCIQIFIHFLCFKWCSLKNILCDRTNWVAITAYINLNEHSLKVKFNQLSLQFYF